MGNHESDVTCADCGELRDPDDDEPCRNCGGTKLNYTLRAEPIRQEVTLKPAKLSVVCEFVRRHPGWTALGVGATVGGVAVGPLLGPVWGTAAGAVCAVVSYLAGRRGETTVREIES